MKDFTLWLIKQIVDHPDEVRVEEKEENAQTILNLSADQEDMGRIIGKGGKIIKALRLLVKIKALAEGKTKPVYLQLVENQ